MFKLPKSIFIFEFKRFTCKSNIIIFLLFFMVCLYLVIEGVAEFQDKVQNKEKFKEIERLKIPQFINYTQYGTFGFRILFLPSPLTVLFYNSCAFSELTASVDTSERMKIYNPFKGKTLFSEKSGSFTDFAGIVILLAGFMVLLYGFDTFIHEDYLKFLSSISGHKKIFWFVLISRVILLNLFFLLLIGFSTVWVLINGINIFNVFFLWFVFVLLLVITFFFMSGVIIGTLKRKTVMFIVLAAFYSAFVFIFPFTINKIISKKAANITDIYQLEMEKLETIIKFEKRAIASEGKYEKWKGKTQSGRELVESFWNGEFKKMQEIETSMRKEMQEYIQKFQWYSLIFPTTFYQSVCNEVSSRGYNSFIDYYGYIQSIGGQFMRYYIDKKFYSNDDKIESFVKGDENIFHSKSSLPKTFLPGVMLNLFYIFLLCGFSYHRFKKKLIRDAGTIRRLEIDIKPGKLNYLLTRDEGLKNQVFNYFTGKGQKFIEVKIDGQEPERRDFVYLPDTQKLPNDISNKALYTLLFKQKFKVRYKKWEILVDYAFEKAPNKIIILDDFFKNLRKNEIEEIKREIESKGLVSLYISGDYYQALAIADKVFFSLEDISVEALKEINDSKKGKT